MHRILDDYHKGESGKSLTGTLSLALGDPHEEWAEVLMRGV